MYSPVVLLKKQNTYKTVGNCKTLRLYYDFIKIAASTVGLNRTCTHGTWSMKGAILAQRVHPWP